MKIISVFIDGDDVYKLVYKNEEENSESYYYGYGDCCDFFADTRKKLELANEIWLYRTYHQYAGFAYGPRIEKLYKEQYFKGNLSHRLDGPSYITYHNGSTYRAYHIDGVSMGANYISYSEEEIRNHGLLL